jgi:uncharacterized protein YkwD
MGRLLLLPPLLASILVIGDSVTLASPGAPAGLRQAAGLATGAEQGFYHTPAAPAASELHSKAGGIAAVPMPPPPPPPPPPPEQAWAPWSAPAAQSARTANLSAPPRLMVSTQQTLTNVARADADVRPLNWSDCLAGVAAQNAQRMAAAGAISHTDGARRALDCGLGSAAAENVGVVYRGVDDAAMFTLYMNSPHHREAILDARYRWVGTAWVLGPDGRGYSAVEFSA